MFFALKEMVDPALEDAHSSLGPSISISGWSNVAAVLPRRGVRDAAATSAAATAAEVGTTAGRIETIGVPGIITGVPAAFQSW